MPIAFLLYQLFLLSFFSIFLVDGCLNLVILTYVSRIFQMPKLGTKLKQDSIPLKYTPRKFTAHPSNGYFYIIEADHRVMGEGVVAQKVEEMVSYPINRRTRVYVLTTCYSVLQARW